MTEHDPSASNLSVSVDYNEDDNLAQYDTILTTVESSSVLHRFSKPLVYHPDFVTYEPIAKQVLAYESDHKLEVASQTHSDDIKRKNLKRRVHGVSTSSVSSSEYRASATSRNDSFKESKNRYSLARKSLRLDGDPFQASLGLFNNIEAINKVKTVRRARKRTTAINELSKMNKDNTENKKFMILKTIWSARFTMLTFCIPIFYVPLILIWNYKEIKALYCVLVLVTYWISNVVPITVTAFMPLMMFPVLRLMECDSVSLLYSTDSTFVLFGAALFGLAFTQWKVNKRCAYWIIFFAGTSSSMILFAFIIVCAFLALITNVDIITVVMLSIGQAVLEYYDRARKITLAQDGASEKEIRRSEQIFKQFCTALKLAVPFSISVSTLASYQVSEISNFIIKMIIWHRGSLNIEEWYIIVAPYVILCLLFLWIMLTWMFLGIEELFRRGNKRLKMQTLSLVKIEYLKLGKVKFIEVVLIVLFLLQNILIFLHKASSIHSLGLRASNGVIVMYFTIFLFICPSRLPHTGDWNVLKRINNSYRYKLTLSPILRWPDVAQNLPWDLFFLYGCFMCIGQMLIRSGLPMWVGYQVANYCSNMLLLILLLTCVCLIFTTFIFTLIATRIIVIIALTLAYKLDIQYLLVIIVAYLNCSNSHLFIFSSSTNMLAFASGNITRSTLLKAGSLFTVICIGIQFICMIFLYIYFDLDKEPSKQSNQINVTFIYYWPITNVY